MAERASEACWLEACVQQSATRAPTTPRRVVMRWKVSGRRSVGRKAAARRGLPLEHYPEHLRSCSARHVRNLLDGCRRRSRAAAGAPSADGAHRCPRRRRTLVLRAANGPRVVRYAGRAWSAPVCIVPVSRGKMALSAIRRRPQRVRVKASEGAPSDDFDRLEREGKAGGRGTAGSAIWGRY